VAKRTFGDHVIAHQILATIFGIAFERHRRGNIEASKENESQGRSTSAFIVTTPILTKLRMVINDSGQVLVNATNGSGV
jgi:hypothetical protein